MHVPVRNPKKILNSHITRGSVVEGWSWPRVKLTTCYCTSAGFSRRKGLPGACCAAVFTCEPCTIALSMCCLCVDGKNNIRKHKKHSGSSQVALVEGPTSYACVWTCHANQPLTLALPSCMLTLHIAAFAEVWNSTMLRPLPSLPRSSWS